MDTNRCYVISSLSYYNMLWFSCSWYVKLVWESLFSNFISIQLFNCCQLLVQYTSTSNVIERRAIKFIYGLIQTKSCLTASKLPSALNISKAATDVNNKMVGRIRSVLKIGLILLIHQIFAHQIKPLNESKTHNPRQIEPAGYHDLSTLDSQTKSKVGPSNHTPSGKLKNGSTFLKLQ